MRKQLPSFASGVLITCPAPAVTDEATNKLAEVIFGDDIKGWGACGAEVSVSADEWASGVVGYCTRHIHLEQEC